MRLKNKLRQYFTPVIITAVLAIILSGTANLSALTGECNSFFDCFDKGYRVAAQEEKLVYFTKALKLWAPSDGASNKAVVYNNRGIAYHALRKFDKAIAEYGKAIVVDPKDIDGYYNRGISYSSLKQYDKALADYDKAIEIKPSGEYGPGQKGAAYSNRGVIYNHLKKYDKAIADFDSALSLAPKFAVAYVNRANSYCYKKEYGKAIADYDRAIALDPTGDCGTGKKGEAYAERGGVYLWLNKCDQAKSDFEKAIALNDKTPSPHSNLGVYWWACRKNKETALKWFEKSFQRGFDQWEELYQETDAGHFLKGLNDAPEFKALVKKYKKTGE
ncbi:MAG: hypothetical protein A2X31_05435 [Elusimicrobia bacterium GWB2_63_22]|nr:MAG: hypothetical protein A2X31_05435 [Elusimicrobia bacterium GWB2_63_22]